MSKISISLLSKFTEKEHIEFKKFVQPGIFTSDKRIVKLYCELKKHAIGRNLYNNLLEVRIYNSVFKQKLKNEKLNIPQKKQLNVLTNTLIRIAEDFLVFKLMKHKPQLKKEILYEALIIKKEFKLLEKHIKSDRKKIDSIEDKTQAHYRFLYKIEHYYLQLLDKNGLLHKQDNLILVNQNLDISYILEKLSLWISMHSIEQVTQRKFDHKNFKIVESFTENSIYKSNATIIIYKAMINLVKEKTEICYNQLLETLNKYSPLVNDEVLVFGYSIAANFCAFNIRRGVFNYNRLLKIYQTLDNKSLLLEQGFMSIPKLNNLIAVGCQTKQFNWAETILKKYINYVNRPAQKCVFEFCKGQINFSKKKYNIALQNFIRVDNVDFNIDMSYRIMMMKSHYEIDTEYDERTIQIFRSAEKFYISNKLLSTNRKAGYKNFIRMLINLYRIKHKVSKMKISSFHTKLESQKFNQSKNWLLSKLEELRNKPEYIIK